MVGDGPSLRLGLRSSYVGQICRRTAQSGQHGKAGQLKSGYIMAAASRRHALAAALAVCSLVFVLLYLQADAGGKKPMLAASDEDVQQDLVVIYNRIPKTASTAFMRLPYELCERNGFHVLLVNNSRPQHVFTLKDEREFAKNVSLWREKRPALYHGHFAYVDFPRLGINDVKPVYINIVREPLERLVSYYYFLRYGDDFLVNKVRSRMGDTVTFDECVERGGRDCDPKRLWLQIPWFCGSFKKVKSLFPDTGSCLLVLVLGAWKQMGFGSSQAQLGGEVLPRWHHGRPGDVHLPVRVLLALHVLGHHRALPELGREPAFEEDREERGAQRGHAGGPEGDKDLQDGEGVLRFRRVPLC